MARPRRTLFDSFVSAATVAVLCIFGAPISAEPDTEDGPLHRARPPVFFDVDLRDQPEIGLQTREEIHALVREYAPDLRRAVYGYPGRLIAVRVRGTVFNFDEFGPARRQAYMESLGLDEFETKKRHEYSLNSLVRLLIRAVKRTHPDAEIGAFGLPVEADANNQQSVQLTNRRYEQAILSCDMLISDKSFIFSGSEWDHIRDRLGEAFRLRGERPVLYRANGEWHIAYGEGSGQDLEPISPGTREEQHDDRDPTSAWGGGGGGGDEGPYQDDREPDGSDDEQENGGEGPREPERIYWAGKGDYAPEADLSPAPLIDDRVVIFYERELGLYPKIKDGDRIHGGVPQAVDLDAHLAAIHADIAELIPDPEWDGYAVIDYEHWKLVWEHTPRQYRTYSRRLIRDEYPNLTVDIEIARARRAYETAAAEFMVATIERCRQLRPNAKWGFWGYGRNWQRQHEQYDVIWECSDVFYPSFYAEHVSIPDTSEQPPGPGEEYAMEYRERIRRTMNFLDQIRGDREVVGFLWRCYADRTNREQWRNVNDLDLELMMTEPFDRGADALILWDSLLTAEERDAFNAFYADRMAPYVRELTSE